jgi:hypothetical protein
VEMDIDGLSDDVAGNGEVVAMASAPTSSLCLAFEGLDTGAPASDVKASVLERDSRKALAFRALCTSSKI